MITIEKIKSEAKKALEYDTVAERVCGYRYVLTLIVDYIFEKKNVKKPEKASLLELIDGETVCDYINDADIIKSLHYIRILGINAEHNQKVKKSEEKLAQSNLTYVIGLIESQENGKRDLYQKPPYMSEAATRKLYIDLYLREAGWDVLETENVAIAGKAGIEIKVDGMPNSQGVGFCDYVLYGRDGKPLAIVEAKKTSVSPEKGRHQVDLYGECMKAVYGYKPVLYYTNGYIIKVIDGLYPDRNVMAFHTIDELERMIQKRDRKDITDTKVNPEIAGRPYQSMAITNICEWLNLKHRRGLLVMATGTGKTRVSIALVDVLTRNNWVKNVLFLADRTSLVHQAKVNFNKLLPDMSICELSGSDEKDYNARLMFCTYQTMINYIDSEDKRFSSGRFDLIIIDEAHRSIFNKYGSIFKYFDSLLVGLTATPKNEVDASTYQLFNCEQDEPDFAYSLEEAIADHYLVPYKVEGRTTKLLSQGIRYSDLTQDDKEKVDSILVDDLDPDFVIPKETLFKIFYNEETCKRVLEDLMENGLRVDQGERIGKTIIFAYNHRHAQMIVDTFKKIYPKYGDNYCQLIDNKVKHAGLLIDKFDEDDDFRIAVSVDMLDTGIDVPSVLNLVFFKPVKSKIKFVQMIGRGTRLCTNLIDGKDKEYFLIYDYCGNFEYFDENPDGATNNNGKTLTQRLFDLKLDILVELQKYEHQSNPVHKEYYDILKPELIEKVKEIKNNSSKIAVREKMEYVDKYFDDDRWQALSILEAKEIQLHLSKLIDSEQNQVKGSLSFDFKMLMAELSVLSNGSIAEATKQVSQVRKISRLLLDNATIPSISDKAETLQSLLSTEFWEAPTVDKLEEYRKEIRDLVQYIINVIPPVDIIVDDKVIDVDYTGNGLVDIRTYREKIIDYLAEHTDNKTIKKIHNLEKIDADDIKELERILWEELGTQEDYEKLTDISNLAVLKSVVDYVGIPDGEKADVFRFIGEKNLHQLSEKCRELGVSDEKFAILKGIVSLHGTPEKVFPKAEKLLKDIDCRETFAQFKKIVLALDNQKEVNIDFSVVDNVHYYNGIVFKGFVEGIPNSVLSGGQYDALLKKMKLKKGAVGFAVYLDMLELLNSARNDYDVDAVLVYDSDASFALIKSELKKLGEEGSVLAVSKIPENIRYKKLVQLQKGKVNTIENNA